MGNYSMPRYFQNMPTVGKAVHANPENVAELKAIEEDIHAKIVAGLEKGKPDEAMNSRGQLTAMQRVTLLVDPGTWCPLNSLYNPNDNKTGTTSIIKGLGRVNGKWCCIIASDNKKHAGTWVPGQADNLLRGSDTAKRLRIRRGAGPAGAGVPQPPGRRHPLLPQLRAQPDGHPRHRGHPRHQPRRRRLPLHQPHRADRP